MRTRSAEEFHPLASSADSCLVGITCGKNPYKPLAGGVCSAAVVQSQHPASWLGDGGQPGL